RPNYDRQQIDANGIDAPVLAWVADPFKLYSMQIQGSGKIQLKDGGLVRLAYAEQNGHPFMPNATRGDSDTMLLAIKARGLQNPPGLDIPGGTRGVKQAGGVDAGVDAEVARVIAALQGNGPLPSAASASSPRPAAQSRPKAKRPATAVAVQSSEVEAMIQALLNAPVADESYVAPVEDEPAAVASTASSGAAPRMDMSEFEGKGSGKPAGQAKGSGVPVPSTGIHDPSYVFFRRIGDGPEGPIGALGVPLSAGRSMAVDPRATPLGAPAFIDGTQPGSKAPMRRLVYAQDTGGAVRGSGRGASIWGWGGEAASSGASATRPAGWRWPPTSRCRCGCCCPSRGRAAPPPAASRPAAAAGCATARCPTRNSASRSERAAPYAKPAPMRPRRPRHQRAYAFRRMAASPVPI